MISSGTKMKCLGTRTQNLLRVSSWYYWCISGIFRVICLPVALAVSRWLHLSPVVHRVWGGCGGAGAGALAWSGPGGVCWVLWTAALVNSIHFCGSFNLVVGSHLSKAGCKLYRCCGSKQTIHTSLLICHYITLQCLLEIKIFIWYYSLKKEGWGFANFIQVCAFTAWSPRGRKKRCL